MKAIGLLVLTVGLLLTSGMAFAAPPYYTGFSGPESAEGWETHNGVWAVNEGYYCGSVDPGQPGTSISRTVTLGSSYSATFSGVLDGPSTIEWQMGFYYGAEVNYVNLQQVDSSTNGSICLGTSSMMTCRPVAGLDLRTEHTIKLNVQAGKVSAWLDGKLYLFRQATEVGPTPTLHIGAIGTNVSAWLDWVSINAQ